MAGRSDSLALAAQVPPFAEYEPAGIDGVLQDVLRRTTGQAQVVAQGVVILVSSQESTEDLMDLLGFGLVAELVRVSVIVHGKRQLMVASSPTAHPSQSLLAAHHALTDRFALLGCYSRPNSAHQPTRPGGEIQWSFRQVQERVRLFEALQDGEVRVVLWTHQPAKLAGNDAMNVISADVLEQLQHGGLSEDGSAANVDQLNGPDDLKTIQLGCSEICSSLRRNAAPIIVGLLFGANPN